MMQNEYLMGKYYIKNQLWIAYATAEKRDSLSLNVIALFSFNVIFKQERNRIDKMAYTEKLLR